MNSIDVVLAILFAGSFISKSKNSLVNSFFKLLGVLFATFVALHYYGVFAKLLARIAYISGWPAYLIAFCLLSTTMMIVFNFIRDGWSAILAIDFAPQINRVFGIIFHIGRMYFLIALIVTGLMITGYQPITSRAHQSFSGQFFRNVSVNVYQKIYSLAIAPLFKSESLNLEVFKATKEPLIRK